MRRTELRYRLKRLGRKMIGSLLSKKTWMGGAKGKEWFLFETNQLLLPLFPIKPKELLW